MGTERSSTPFRLNTFSAFLKHTFLLVIFLFAMDIVANVEVSRARIVSGFTLRIQRYTWASFECHIENSYSSPRDVYFRVVSRDGSPQMSIFSASVKVPAQTAMTYRMPLLVENSDVFDVEAFVDGNKLATTRNNEHNIKLLSGRESQIAILNDSAESLGAFVQLPRFKERIYSSNFGIRSLPSDYNILKTYKALVVCKPDFKNYSNDAFSALLDYVAKGGLLIFADPEGVIAAMDTPLEPLLPVTPIRIREIESVESLSSLLPGFEGFAGRRVKFLDSVAKNETGVNILTHEGAPLIRERSFGLGIVKFIAISPDDSNFASDQSSWGDLLEYLFSHQDIAVVRNSFAEPLDKLTGFTVPLVSSVRNLLIVYFCIIAVILILGALLKRVAFSWLLAALAALLMTGHILNRARNTVGSKSSLLASMKIETLAPMRTSENFISYFAASNLDINAFAESERATFVSIPAQESGMFMPSFAMGTGNNDIYGEKSKKKTIRTSTPIEFKKLNNGVSSISGLNIASRTSKQFMFFTESEQPRVLELPDIIETPELTLTASGWKLKPWKAPDNWSVEEAFAVFPGGSVLLEKTSSGVYALAKQSAIFNDSMMKSIRNALEDGFTKEIPYIALMTQLTDAGLDITGEPDIQGRNLIVIPALVTVPEKKIRITNETIHFFPADGASRMIMTANRINHTNPSQAGFFIRLGLALPAYAPNFKPERITIKLNYNQGGAIRLVPKLILPESKPEHNRRDGIDGKDSGRETYVFEGEDVENFFDPLTKRGILLIESHDRPMVFTSEEQRFRSSIWTLNNVEITIDGSLPENMVPIKY